MIELYQFPAQWNIPNPSPFCLKVETYLRMMGLPYKTVTFYNTQKAPKGKLPFIKDDGQVIADSNLIITHLQKKYGNPLEEHLSEAERAIIHITKRMLDEHTYWAGVYTRWVMESNWPKLKETFFGKLKFPYRLFVPNLVRKNIKDQLYQAGLGRHSEEEIFAMTKADMKALSVILGDKTYFVADTPTTLDASAFAMLINLLEVPIESPLKDYGKTLPNLSGFCQHMKQRYFADWDWR